MASLDGGLDLGTLLHCMGLFQSHPLGVGRVALLSWPSCLVPLCPLCPAMVQEPSGPSDKSI